MDTEVREKVNKALDDYNKMHLGLIELLDKYKKDLEELQTTKFAGLTRLLEKERLQKTIHDIENILYP